jgi:glutamate dehydrogenase/leucine dehydrogenase
MDLSGLDHELLHVSRGPRSDAYTIIAVHSTALGPALGGCRITTYAHPGAAFCDVLRLSAGMTFKAAVAGVDLGGGKGVICVEPGISSRTSCATRCCSTSPTRSSCSAAATSRPRTSAPRRPTCG